jgi:hypothetical protein
MIAALYVDPRGPYFGRPDVDPWGESRDARLYDGPHPVVSHPPCGAWANLRHLSRGAGKDCGPIAVDQVRKWGGVLEQPARSTLWDACGLIKPTVGHSNLTPADRHGGWSLECEQVSWGHVARKRTWLYFIGIDPDLVVRTCKLGGTPTHWVSGGRNCKTGGSVPPGIKVCSAQQRRRTPPLFADWLISLAESVERQHA